MRHLGARAEAPADRGTHRDLEQFLQARLKVRTPATVHKERDTVGQVFALESAGVAVRMDGRGRAFDNVFVERLGRAVKYEDVDIHGYEAVPELRHGLARHFAFYNHARPHQALGYQTPAAVYTSPAPCAPGLSLPAGEG